MAKENVFIVLSHVNSLKKNPKTGKGMKDQWEVQETVEFVNQLRKRHIEMSTIVADYLNRKMVSGSRYGFDDYDKFENYVRGKYAKQMAELDAAYGKQQVVDETKNSAESEVFADEFGNIRARTVFDPA